jgi:hypothetical protein
MHKYYNNNFSANKQNRDVQTREWGGYVVPVHERRDRLMLNFEKKRKVAFTLRLGPARCASSGFGEEWELIPMTLTRTSSVLWL